MTDEAVSATPREPLPWRRRTRVTDASFVSPAVRRLAGAHDLDPRSVRGTGRGGRVTRDDVQGAIAAGGHAPTPTETPGRADAPGDVRVPFNPIRRATAVHLTHALTAAAPAHITVACDYTNVERARRGAGVTYLPFVARAVIDALVAYPHCNATAGDDHLVVHSSVDLGIAVDLDFQGLVVPVVHRAETQRLRSLARSISDLASRARSRSLSPGDVSGGTFTITNPGPFGTFASVPIVNHPQVAILATDSVRKRVVALDGPGGLAIRPIGMLSLAFDHRVMDGAYAAGFVGRVREIVEQRDWTAEL